MLLWAHGSNSIGAGDAMVQALAWQPASGGQAGQWLTSQALLTGAELPRELAACMDDAGATLVGWIRSTGQFSANARLIDTLRTRRHVPGQGWLAEQIVVSATDMKPRQLALSAAAGQGAGALWTNSADYSVQAARMSTDGTWIPLGEASDNSFPLAEIGDPTQLEITQFEDARLLCSWLASDNRIAGILATRVHHLSGDTTN